MRVAVFTDNDFDKMNGVTTTRRSVLRHAPADLRPRVYTSSELEVDEPEYLALHSTGFPIPCYREMRMYLPRIGELARRLVADNVGSLLHRHRIAHRFILVGEGPMTAELKERCPDAVFTGRLAHRGRLRSSRSSHCIEWP